jgi:hypothetical protein
MSQHSSCWLARHQFFIKYCITEKEAFKGEKKLNLLFQLRLWWFLHFIRWLTDCVMGGSTRYFAKLYRLSTFFFPFLKHLDFWSSQRHCLRARRNWLHDKVYAIVPSLLPQQITSVQQPTRGKMDENRAWLYLVEM